MDAVTRRRADWTVFLLALAAWLVWLGVWLSRPVCAVLSAYFAVLFILAALRLKAAARPAGALSLCERIADVREETR